MKRETIQNYREAFYGVLETERAGGPVRIRESVLPADRKWVSHKPVCRYPDVPPHGNRGMIVNGTKSGND